MKTSLITFTTRTVAALIILALPQVFAAANRDESKVGTLPIPDVLVAADGKPLRDSAAWRASRPALLEFFARDVYGRTPAGRPVGMRWETTSVDRTALGGKATRKEITLRFTAQPDGPKPGRSLDFQPTWTRRLRVRRTAKSRGCGKACCGH